ncbi:hypothetical protein MUO65_03635, partial [bacterium]|nr:hypothetical protein [bacterium]
PAVYQYSVCGVIHALSKTRPQNKSWWHRRLACVASVSEAIRIPFLIEESRLLRRFAPRKDI